MSNRDKYLRIYSECLEEEYYDKSIEPLLKNLYCLVYCYERGIKEGKYTNLFMDNYSIDKLRIEFVSKLIDLFKKIVNDNNQNKVYNACRVFLASNDLSKINYGLKTIFYPQDFYREDSDQYYSIMNDIIFWYSHNNDDKTDIIESIDKDLKEILDLYKDYLYAIPNESKDDIYKSISFVDYMKIVIAHYYKDKLDNSIFPKVLDYVYQNIDLIDDFYEMNNYDKVDPTINDDYICQKIVDKIIENCTKNNQIIK